MEVALCLTHSWFCWLVALDLAFAFQVFDPETEDYDLFPPYARGFVGVIDSPANSLAERVNEGSPASLSHPRQWDDVPHRQICPGMVGPMSGDQYFCHGREFGYCDRRTGSCHCNTGYQGVDCGDCTPTHYRTGHLCYPKRPCPTNDNRQCSGAGTCDYTRGECRCMSHRQGSDCSIPQCQVFDALCEECTNTTCTRCLQGYFATESTSSGACHSCTIHDPRCHACNRSHCLECVDPLLRSIRRSGARSTDAALPEDELRRELSLTLPYGTQLAEFFDEAEPFRVVLNHSKDIPLRAAARRCDQGYMGDRKLNCSSLESELSHIVCGHEGTITWSSPTHVVDETAGHVRLIVRRSGGGVGTVRVCYAMSHVTTDGADLSATAAYTVSTNLEFGDGVVELSFLVSIHDDRVFEVDETAIFELLGVSGGATLGPQRRTELKIVDDDAYRTSAANSIIRGDWRGVAGVPSDFVIAAFSGAGEPMRVGGDYFLVEVVPAMPSGELDGNSDQEILFAGAARRVQAYVSDLGNGTYAGNWSARAAGTYQAHAWLAVEGGLRGEYYEDVFADDPQRRLLVLSRIDRRVDFDWQYGSIFGAGGPSSTQVGPDFATVRWLGRLRPDATGIYTLVVAAVGDGLGSRLWLDGRLLLDAWHVKEAPSGERSAEVALVASVFHELTLELRVTRYAGDGVRRGPAPGLAGGYGKKISLMWESAELLIERQVIPSGNLYYLDEVGDGSPVTARVVSAATSAARSYARGGGLSMGEAGQALVVEVLMCDRFGNRRDDVGKLFPEREMATAYDSLATSAEELEYDGLFGIIVNLTLNLPAPGASQEFGARHLTASQTFNREKATTTAVAYPTIAGLYQLDVRFEPNMTRADFSWAAQAGLSRFEHIAGSPFFVSILPAQAFAAFCRIIDRSLQQSIAGERAELRIISVDALDNERRIGGDGPFEIVARYIDWGGNDWSRYGTGTLAAWEKVVSQVGAPMSLVTIGAVTDVGNGTYIANIAPTIAGKHSLSVTLGGVHVAGSPFTFIVGHATAVASSSTAEGRGLIEATVNVTAMFTATCRDAYGNPVPEAEAGLDCYIIGSKINGTCHAIFGNGTALCFFTPLKSGSALLSVTYFGDHIDGSPFSIIVADAPSPHGPASEARGAGLYAAEAGVAASFIITARDVGNNVVDDVGLARKSNFSVDLTHVNSSSAVLGKVFPLGAGEYIATYNVTLSGSYVLNVRDADTGLAIAGSPFLPYVVPTTISALLSSVSGRGVDDDVVSCRRHSVIATARDRFGNQHLNSTERIFSVISGGGAANGSSGVFEETLVVWGTPLSHGLYDLSYEPSVAGPRIHAYYCFEPGLNSELYGEYDLTRPIARRVDLTAIDFDWGAYAPLPTGTEGPDSYMAMMFETNGTGRMRTSLRSDYFSVRWTGMVQFPVAEEYLFRIEADAAAEARLMIDGILVAGSTGDGASRQQYGGWHGTFLPYSSQAVPQTTLLHDIEITYQHKDGDESFLRLSWTRTSLNDWSIVPASAFVRQELIANETYEMMVYSGAAVPRRSSVTGRRMAFPTSIWNNVAVVEVRDACANLRGAVFDSDPVAVVAYGQGLARDQRLLATITDHGNSTYSASILASIAGNYTVVAVVGAEAVAGALASVGDGTYFSSSRAQAERAYVGAHVRGSPWTVAFDPGPISAATTSASGTPLSPSGVEAGVKPALVTIQARDATYNTQQVSTIGEASRFKASLSLSKHAIYFNMSVSPLDAGSYAIDQPSLTVAGAYELRISFEGIEISGSPYRVLCHPGVAAAANTSARGQVPRVALAGVDAEPSRRFVVRARDAYGNPHRLGGAIFVVQLRGGHRTTAGIAEDRGDGTYAIRLTSRDLDAGSYEMHVSLADRVPTGWSNSYGDGGLAAAYYTNRRLYGTPALRRFDSGPVAYNWGLGEVAPGAVDHASVRWTGFLLAPMTASYEFELRIADQYDDARFFIEDALVVRTAYHQFASNRSDLVAGALYRIVIELEEKNQSASISLVWSSEYIVKQVVAARFLFPSAHAISGSPYPLQLISPNTTNGVVARTLFYAEGQPQYYADSSPSWLVDYGPDSV